MNRTELLILLICGVLVVAVLILFLPTRRSRTEARTPDERQPTDDIYRDDDRYWYGFIYNNPDDPAVFVPKRYGLGWTINFGHPLGKWILIGTLLLPAVLVVLSVLATGGATIGCHTFGCMP